MHTLRECLNRKVETLTFTARTKKEQFALTCSVLEEDAALAQVRWGGAACSCRRVQALREGLCKEVKALTFAVYCFKKDVCFCAAWLYVRCSS